MPKDKLRIECEYRSGHWDKVWKVYYGETLLLQTKDEKQATETYEKYSINPPQFYKIPDVIF